jgi:hypothetical protein
VLSSYTTPTSSTTPAATCSFAFEVSSIVRRVLRPFASTAAADRGSLGRLSNRPWEPASRTPLSAEGVNCSTGGSSIAKSAGPPPSLPDCPECQILRRLARVRASWGAMRCRLGSQHRTRLRRRPRLSVTVNREPATDYRGRDGNERRPTVQCRLHDAELIRGGTCLKSQIDRQDDCSSRSIAFRRSCSA